MTVVEMLHKAVDHKLPVIAVFFTIASAVLAYIYWTGRKRSRGMKGRLLSREELEKAKWERVGKISKVWLYPVKSCIAISLKSAQACPLGLTDGNMRDRSFAFTTEKGMLIKGCISTGVVRIKPVVKDRLLILQHPLEEDLKVDLDQVEAEKKEASINIYGDIASGYDCGEVASQWLTKVLGTKAHLLYHSTILSPRKPKELVGQFPLAKDNDKSLYANIFPFMLMTKASIADLQSRVSCPTPPENFRPNLLVEGSVKAYDEDDWAYIKIGDAVFRHVVPCGRCLFTTVNRETGVKEANMEPLRTLRKYRPNIKNSPFLGIHLALETMGTVREEDEVYVTRFSKMQVCPSW